MPAPPVGSLAANVRTIGGGSCIDNESMKATRRRDKKSLGRGKNVWLESEAIHAADFTRNTNHAMKTTEDAAYCTWMCLICGYVYDEAAGSPEEGIPAGTRWRDIPINWVCPECGARKDEFEMLEI